MWASAGFAEGARANPHGQVPTHQGQLSFFKFETLSEGRQVSYHCFPAVALRNLTVPAPSGCIALVTANISGLLCVELARLPHQPDHIAHRVGEHNKLQLK